MGRYGLISLGMIVVFLALFGVVEALGVPLLSEGSWIDGEGQLVLPEHSGAGAALIGVVLLVVDVLLPVPSSVVMLAHGALFGVVGGTALSLVGSTLAGAVAFWLGRRGGPLLQRLVSESDRARADALLARYGLVALVITRPVPMIAETLAILAGTSSLRAGPAVLAMALGSIPAAALYAVTGATAARLDNMLWIFALVMVIAGGFWWVARRAALKSAPRSLP
ncbi:MAG: TVP38/TMEM64 family protein [Bradymonadia bacterium]